MSEKKEIEWIDVKDELPQKSGCYVVTVQIDSANMGLKNVVPAAAVWFDAQSKKWSCKGLIERHPVVAWVRDVPPFIGTSGTALATAG